MAKAAVLCMDQALKKQLEDSMPGMEAAITTLRERVDGPDVMSASRAAQFALIGAPMTRQKASFNVRPQHLFWLCI